MKPPLLPRRALASAVVLAALLAGAGILRSSADPSPSSRGHAAPLASPEDIGQEAARRAAARQVHGDSRASIEANGAARTRAEAEAALDEEARMAAQSRQELFASNIHSLRAAAVRAAAEGQPARAALMEKRADALAHRLAEESAAE